ncbi:ATPase [Altererythrobacter xixiisoli]|uniref:ATPase n=1 Tax=Croceibacterium xixiisoli TaxID=1476466 RepID=A0A6I4TXW0_9SPHN|nr:ATPase [Croceibacterium xixiisoli]MXO99901.1 ATPase [Croceibacterium xixiisoli]
MTGRNNLIAVGQAADEPQDTLVLDEAYSATVEDVGDELPWHSGFDEEPAARPQREWLLPAAAGLVTMAWTGFFLWANSRAILNGATPAKWSALISEWAIPVVLVVGIWMLVMRSSRREANRFGDAARLLSEESRLLETRLETVNRELSLARDFIAAQSRDLESLGRVAAERLSSNADRLQQLVRNNGAQVEAIGAVSVTAVENMDRLRDSLPVISNSMRDVASQIGQAGNVAHTELEGLVEGLGRLKDAGTQSDQQIASVQRRVEEVVSTFTTQAEHMDNVATTRFGMLAERSAAFRAELDGREVEAFAALHRRADALSEELAQRSEAIRSGEEEAVVAMRERMAALRQEGTQLTAALRDGQEQVSDVWGQAITSLEAQLYEALERMAAADSKALDAARQRLDALDAQAQQIDTTIVRRRELLDAEFERRSRQADDREATAIAGLEARMAGFDQLMVDQQKDHLAHLAAIAQRCDGLQLRLTQLTDGLQRLTSEGGEAQERVAIASHDLSISLDRNRNALKDSGEQLARLTEDSMRLLEIIRSGAQHSREELPDALEEAETRLNRFDTRAQELTALIVEANLNSANLANHVENAFISGQMTVEQLQQIEKRLNGLAQLSEALSVQSRSELAAAVATLEQKAGSVLSALRSEKSEAIREIAEQLAIESGAAVDQVLSERAATSIASLEDMARRAGEAGRETLSQLGAELDRVSELADSLETRVADAREQATEQVDNDFTRRTALITESLNSAAIDIAKALESEVSDTAWASYLRGDRGIFTRRAVKLLDAADARGVTDIYQADDEFRHTVNRYIHDFESMLRTVLATRDGHSMAVTLLSSDMGKLYVVLAQAIDRLRD